MTKKCLLINLRLQKSVNLTLFRVVLRIGLSVILFSWCGAIAAEAQSAPVAVSDFEVAGVKLGMTVDQTLAALKSFDIRYVITKHYWQQDYRSFAQTGGPMDKLNPGDSNNLKPSFAFFTDLVAEDGSVDCRVDDVDPCGSAGKPYDLVHVWFSPVIGQERVIAIQRNDNFYSDNGSPYGDPSKEPATSNVTAALNTKYSTPSYSMWATNFPAIEWDFDDKGRLISPARAHELGLDNQSIEGIPPSVNSTDNVKLDVIITLAGGPTLVQEIDSVLFDGGALYNSVAQGHDTYESQNTKMNAQDAASAAKNGNSPNL